MLRNPISRLGCSTIAPISSTWGRRTSRGCACSSPRCCASRDGGGGSSPSGSRSRCRATRLTSSGARRAGCCFGSGTARATRAASRSRGDRVELRPPAVRAAAVRRGGGERRSARGRRRRKSPSGSASRRMRSTPALFADLPGERAVRAPDPIPTPAEIALHTNLALAQAVVMRAAHVSLRVEGGLRPIVRLAKFRGLLCNVAAPAAGALPRAGHLGAVLAVPPHAGLRARARRVAAPPRLVRALRARRRRPPARAARAGDDGERRPDLPGARAGAVRQPAGRALRGGRRAAWPPTGT